MIRVTFYQNKEKKYTGFTMAGHSGYDESGKDIICAAVSVLAQNTVNSIERFTKDEFSAEVDPEKGELSVRLALGYSKETALLLDSLILGLQGIEEEYTNYIDVIFEEV